MILNIETATQICSVSLAKDGKVIALRESNEKNSHASLLSIFIDEVINEASISLNDIQAIAISKGPGSYTGLRIGVSTAKGLAYGLGVPLISVSTLQAMAWGLSSKLENQENTLFAPMIDARRMEVYSAFYNSKNEIVKEISADIIDSDSYLNFLQQHKIIFFGDGADKCKEAISHENATFVEMNPSSAFMAQIAQTKFENQQFENVAYFEPFYLKDFIATKPKPLNI